MGTLTRRGGITIDEHTRGRKCYALVLGKDEPGSLPARRCHHNARLDYGYEGHVACVCKQHARMLERWIEGPRNTLDFAITMLIRWSQ